MLGFRAEFGTGTAFVAGECLVRTGESRPTRTAAQHFGQREGEGHRAETCDLFDVGLAHGALMHDHACAAAKASGVRHEHMDWSALRRIATTQRQRRVAGERGIRPGMQQRCRSTSVEVGRTPSINQYTAREGGEPSILYRGSKGGVADEGPELRSQVRAV